MILNLFKKRPERSAAEAMHAAAVAASRAPELYLRGGVADTMDGRFDSLTLHLWLVLRRLRGGGPYADAAAQALVDRCFRTFDDALREMGVGDLTVPKRVRKMAELFYGRVAAYDAALDGGDDGALQAALARNLFRGQDEPAAERLSAMDGYVRAAEAALTATALDDVLAGRFAFGAALAALPEAAA